MPYITVGQENSGPIEERFQASWNTATSASAIAAVACIPARLTGFRDDLPKIDVPVLMMQGDQDRILPPEHSGAGASHSGIPAAGEPAARTSNPNEGTSCAPSPDQAG